MSYYFKIKILRFIYIYIFIYRHKFVYLFISFDRLINTMAWSPQEIIFDSVTTYTPPCFKCQNQPYPLHLSLQMRKLFSAYTYLDCPSSLIIKVSTSILVSEITNNLFITVDSLNIS